MVRYKVLTSVILRQSARSLRRVIESWFCLSLALLSALTCMLNSLVLPRTSCCPVHFNILSPSLQVLQVSEPFKRGLGQSLGTLLIQQQGSTARLHRLLQGCSFSSFDSPHCPAFLEFLVPAVCGVQNQLDSGSRSSTAHPAPSTESSQNSDSSHVSLEVPKTCPQLD